jgi:predicted transcriptional regulator of viral defense system
MSVDRRELQRKLRRLAATQSGYFTAAQALDLGYSYPAQTYHTQHGNWQRVARGIYRLPEWPVGDHDDIVRWTLWSRGLGVASHNTAISIHDLADVNPRLVHLTVPPGFRAKAEGIVLHHAELAAGDVWDREGYRITTPFRTAIDSAADELSLEQLTEVVKNVFRQAPHTAPQQLKREAEGRGHRAALRMERALRGAGAL